MCKRILKSCQAVLVKKHPPLITPLIPPAPDVWSYFETWVELWTFQHHFVGVVKSMKSLTNYKQNKEKNFLFCFFVFIRFFWFHFFFFLIFSSTCTLLSWSLTNTVKWWHQTFSWKYFLMVVFHPLPTMGSHL